MHLVGRQRVDEVHPGRAPEIGVHRFPHHRAEMDGIHQLHLRILLRNLPQRQHNVLHRLAVILPAVAGDEDDLFLPVGQVVQFVRGKFVILPDGGFQCVDHRIAGDEQPLGDILPQEVILVVHRRAEIKIRNGGNQLAVHFLREGRILVIGSETGLHMAHLHLMVKGGQGPGKGGGGIPVDQDHIRLQGVNSLVHTGEALAGDGG